MQTIVLAIYDAIVAGLGWHTEVVGLVARNAGHWRGDRWRWHLDTAADLVVDQARLEENDKLC